MVNRWSRFVALLLVLVLVGGAAAQGNAQFRAFSDDVFEGLWANDFDCGSFGFAVHEFDLNRCGRINDNMVRTNKQIIDRRIREHGLVALVPWQQNVTQGTTIHTVGFWGGPGTLRYTLLYLELGPDSSIVWLAADR